MSANAANKRVSPSRVALLTPECCNMLSKYVHNIDSNQTSSIPCNGDRLKLQVVEKSGCLFAISAAQLSACREAEVKGHGSRVVIDVLPTGQVPVEVMNKITVPGTTVDKEANITNSGTENGTAAMTSELHNGFSTDTDESGTDSSKCADSDSEFDWSHDEPETSDLNDSDSDSETLLETAV